MDMDSSSVSSDQVLFRHFCTINVYPWEGENQSISSALDLKKKVVTSWDSDGNNDKSYSALPWTEGKAAGSCAEFHGTNFWVFKTAGDNDDDDFLQSCSADLDVLCSNRLCEL